MPVGLRCIHRLLQVPCLIAISAFAGNASPGQAQSCPALKAPADTPAFVAYRDAHYSRAEDLYGQDLSKRPDDLQIAAALVQTLLHEGEVARASSQVEKMMATDARSAISLTALAEVQLRQGEPWVTLETLKSALSANPCYARAHLIRSRALRIDSMHASERAEIQTAYDMDPIDPDIRHAWLSTVSPAHEIEGIQQGLATMKDLAPETRQKAQISMLEMLPLLSEDTQTCKILPTVESATLPLLPSYLDPKHVDGYRLEVQLPQTKASLEIDTAASGIYITRALAEQNGLHARPDDPPGTVLAESVRIGPLEFRNCIVGVSEAPFSGKMDGFIGTDIFTSYLVTLNQPQSKLVLEPLPRLPGILPGDRPNLPELRDFTRVYHREQFLLIPVMLNSKTSKLFALDTGIRFSTMTSDVAHSVSTTKINFTNTVQTVSGAKLQVYRDSFNMQFADISLEHQSHVLEFDPSAIEEHTGLQIAGMLGFDLLHSLVLHLDYRDGLVKVETPDTSNTRHSGGSLTASATENESMQCPRFEERDLPTDSTIAASVMNLLDSSHLKPGKEIVVKVLNEWQSDKCTLPAGSMLYGHVTAAKASRNPGESELALVIDHGECSGESKKELPLKILALVAPPSEFVGLHSILPAEVRGGARQLSDTTGGLYDDNLNPGGQPHTVHPGVVAGYKDVKLDAVGGPACSARFTSTEPSVRLWTGSELILTMLAGH